MPAPNKFKPYSKRAPRVRVRRPGDLWVLSIHGKYLARGRNIPRPRAAGDSGPYGYYGTLHAVGAAFGRPAFLRCFTVGQGLCPCRGILIPPNALSFAPSSVSLRSTASPLRGEAYKTPPAPSLPRQRKPKMPSSLLYSQYILPSGFRPEKPGRRLFFNGIRRRKWRCHLKKPEKLVY